MFDVVSMAMKAVVDVILRRDLGGNQQRNIDGVLQGTAA